MSTTRESYRVFPAWTNPFWTWLTGVPLPGEQPMWRLGPCGFLACALASFGGGVALAVAGLRIGGLPGWLVLCLGWCLTTSGSRRLVSTAVHQCIHNRFSSRRAVDRWVGEALTVLTFTQTAQAYRREHFLQHHRFGVFTTPDDPAAKFLYAVGFKPGLALRRLWARLLLNLVSPRFHGHFLAVRLRSNLLEAPLPRRLCAGLHAAAWLAAAACGLLSAREIALAFIVPVVFMYQASVLLEFISEHAWFVPAPPAQRARDVHGTHSWGRFCGSPVPQCRGADPAWRRTAQWAAWVLAHLCYHLPVRVLVLPGDLPQHDFHHRRPNTGEWTRAAYGRQRDVQSLAPDERPYAEFWGLHRAIAHVLSGISRAPAVSSGAHRFAAIVLRHEDT